MAVPRDELSLIIREWYYSASEGQLEKFLSFFDPANSTYFGTDPQELWYGYDEIRANVAANFEKYGKWTLMSKNLKIHQFGDVVVFTDEAELSARLQESSIAEDVRVSGVLVLKNGIWKIVQAHISFGIPNSQILPE